MTGAKQLPIAAAIAGLLAAIGITVKLAGTSTNPLEARVDELLSQERELEASDPFENLTSRIKEFYSVRYDADFAKLRPSKKEMVGVRFAELLDLARYQAFEKQLNEMSDPKTARSRTQLSGIEYRLREVEVPERIPDVVKHGTAIQRREEWLEDIVALQTAFQQLEEDYSQLIHKANTVLSNKNEPQLPDRIQNVMTLAKNLKTPENKDLLVPGSKRVRYSMVFQLAEIEKLDREWNKLKVTLEPALKAKTP